MLKHEDKARLIGFVRERPVIWDARKEGYHDRNLKESAWTAIAKEMYVEKWDRATSTEQGEMLADLQKEWKCLQDGFDEELLRQTAREEAEKKRLQLTINKLKDEDPQQEEEQDSLSGYCTSTGTSSDSSPEPAKAGEKRPGLATQPENQQANFRKAVGYATKRARVARPVSWGIDSPGLEFHSTRRSEGGWPDVFGQIVTKHCKYVLPQFELPLQNAILTLFEACKPPNSPAKCFQALDHWRVNRYMDASVPGQSTYAPSMLPPDHHPYVWPVSAYYPSDEYQGTFHRGDQYQAPPEPSYQALATPQHQAVRPPSQTFPTPQQHHQLAGPSQVFPTPQHQPAGQSQAFPTPQQQH